MNPRLARSLTRLYPRAWRDRYGEEFEAFLETHPSTLQAVGDVVGSAFHARVCLLDAFTMDSRQRSLVMMTYAYLAAAAGVNFYFSVDDTPLAEAMRSHAALSMSFRLVAKSSFLAFATVVAVAVPVAFRMLRVAFTERRWDVVGRLAVPPAAALITVAWMAAASIWTGTHWVPMPWDVAGDWNAPADWPPLGVRWPLGAVTFVLLVVGLVASAISVAQAISRSDLTRHRPLWLKITSVTLAGSIVLMALGVVAWGWFAERDASEGFHARNGGLFVSTSFASWTASCAVFVMSVVIALRGAGAAIAVQGGSTRS